MPDSTSDMRSQAEVRADEIFDARVSYSVRDLLDEIRLNQLKGFERLENSLYNKADKRDLGRMEARLDNHQTLLDTQKHEIVDLQGWKHDVGLEHKIEKKWSWKKRVWAAFGSIGVILATVLGPYIGSHLHL